MSSLANFNAWLRSSEPEPVKVSWLSTLLFATMLAGVVWVFLLGCSAYAIRHRP